MNSEKQCPTEPQNVWSYQCGCCLNLRLSTKERSCKTKKQQLVKSKSYRGGGGRGADTPPPPPPPTGPEDKTKAGLERVESPCRHLEWLYWPLCMPVISSFGTFLACKRRHLRRLLLTRTFLVISLSPHLTLPSVSPPKTDFENVQSPGLITGIT